jgi:hypothetical protein
MSRRQGRAETRDDGSIKLYIYEGLTENGAYYSAEKEQILAQPCVVEALKQAQEAGRTKCNQFSADVVAARKERDETEARLEAVHAREMAVARAAWEREQADDAALVRTVARSLRAVGAEVPTPLREAEEGYLLTHPVVVKALREARATGADRVRRMLRGAASGGLVALTSVNLVVQALLDYAPDFGGDPRRDPTAPAGSESPPE